MRTALELLLLLLAVGLQVALWPQLSSASIPAIILAVAAVQCLHGDPGGGLRSAFAGGLLLDLYAQHHFGLFTLATLIGYGVCWMLAGNNAEELRVPGRIGIFLAGAVAYELVVVLFINMVTKNFPFFASLTQTATLNVAATMLIFFLLTPLAKMVTRPTHGPI